jgi:hypothetical protein
MENKALTKAEEQGMTYIWDSAAGMSARSRSLPPPALQKRT